MRADVKKRWVEALRSGQYKQGRENLNSFGELCCLGVLCELAADEGVVERRKLPSGSVGYGGPAAWRTDFLPFQVTAWAGLPNDNPAVDGSPLSEWNDNRRSSFDDIADMIEQEAAL